MISDSIEYAFPHMQGRIGVSKECSTLLCWTTCWLGIALKISQNIDWDVWTCTCVQVDSTLDATSSGR